MHSFKIFVAGIHVIDFHKFQLPTLFYLTCDQPIGGYAREDNPISHWVSYAEDLLVLRLLNHTSS